MKGWVCLSPQGLAAFGWSWKTSVSRNSSGVCVPLRRPRRGSAPHQTSLGRPVSPLQSPSGKGWPPSSDGLCPGPLSPCTGCQPGRDSHVQLCSVRIPRAKENAFRPSHCQPGPTPQRWGPPSWIPPDPRQVPSPTLPPFSPREGQGLRPSSALLPAPRSTGRPPQCCLLRGSPPPVGLCGGAAPLIPSVPHITPLPQPQSLSPDGGGPRALGAPGMTQGSTKASTSFLPLQGPPFPSTSSPHNPKPGGGLGPLPPENPSSEPQVFSLCSQLPFHHTPALGHPSVLEDVAHGHRPLLTPSPSRSWEFHYLPFTLTSQRLDLLYPSCLVLHPPQPPACTAIPSAWTAPGSGISPPPPTTSHFYSALPLAPMSLCPPQPPAPCPTHLMVPHLSSSLFSPV